MVIFNIYIFETVRAIPPLQLVLKFGWDPLSSDRDSAFTQQKQNLQGGNKNNHALISHVLPLFCMLCVQAFVNSVAEFSEQGADIYGLGVQSHLRGWQNLEAITLLQV